MTTTSATSTTVQVHRVFIKATPEAIWDAITKPEWQERYGYRTGGEYDLRPGGAFRVPASAAMKEHGAPDTIIDGEVIEADPPRRLVQTWRALFSPETAEEGHRRLTWEIDDHGQGVTRLTVTHDVEGSPMTAAQVAGDVEGAGGGWPYILSDLKTLLESGDSMEGGTSM
jgi:uncharacterized protein YndB with AHSA1/START domain